MNAIGSPPRSVRFYTRAHSRMRAPPWRRSLWLALALWVVLAAPAQAIGGGGENEAAALSASQRGAAATTPTRIVIAAIKLDAAIEPVGLVTEASGAHWDIPEKNVGWHDASALPSQGGNVVLSGHNATQGERVFRRLHKLKVGDAITVYVGEQAFAYEVTERVILREVGQPRRVRLANARWIEPYPEERLTLVTCYPAWTNTHRLVVVAEPR